MANTTETATFNVKSNIGQVSKDAKQGAADIAFMGVSVNSLKAGFSKAMVTAKGLFSSVKAGLISTGIGAFVVLIGSLVSYFTNTKRGADKLAQAFSAIGAVVSVLMDRLSKVGEALSFVFSGEFRKAGEAMKGTFSGIADEVEREVKAMVELKKRTQDLRDADMEFMVQKAKTRQEIEKARLIAEDETKSAAERLDNLKKALELEAETTQKEIELAKERMAIQKEEMALSENLEEDEQKLAELKAAIIEKETASIKMRRRVVTEVNALEREIQAEEKARSKEKQDRIDADLKKKQDAIDAEMAKIQELRDLEQQRINDLTVTGAELLDKYYESQLTAQERETNAVYDKYFAIIEGKRALGESVVELEEAQQSEVDAIRGKYAEKQVKWSEMTKEEQLGIASSTAGDMAAILGKETIAGKAAAIAQATIDTYKGANAAYASMAIIPGIGPALGAVAAGAAIASGIANVKAIASTGGGGGGGAGASASTPNTTATPAPQMMSGQFELGGGIKPEPIKAFVVTDEMTNSQDQLANIRRRATI
tara:strand:- start:2550 stop:4169 length:1620 start_codon:yes stop_codon:yes gene_type:complete